MRSKEVTRQVKKIIIKRQKAIRELPKVVGYILKKQVSTEEEWKTICVAKNNPFIIAKQSKNAFWDVDVLQDFMNMTRESSPRDANQVTPGINDFTWWKQQDGCRGIQENFVRSDLNASKLWIIRKIFWTEDPFNLYSVDFWKFSCSPKLFLLFNLQQNETVCDSGEQREDGKISQTCCLPKGSLRHVTVYSRGQSYIEHIKHSKITNAHGPVWKTDWCPCWSKCI